MVFDCSGPRFGAMKNPYTGEIIRVKMSTSSTGAIRFFAPDTYSPTNVYPTAKEAYRNWNRVNGVEGWQADRLCVHRASAPSREDR